MIRKRMITLAGVVGVLLCGACGLTFRELPPPPPPTHVFVNLHTVRVVVINKTATHEINPVAMKAAVIHELNSTRKQSPLLAVPDGDADCTLTLDVVKEEEYLSTPVYMHEVPEPAAPLWQFHGVISAELKSKDGQEIWSDPSWGTWRRETVAQMRKKSRTPGWSDPGFRKAFFPKYFVSDVASQFVYNLLSK